MRYNRFHKDTTFLTPTTYTQQLSEYTVKLRYEDIPPEVIERAKMVMMQTVGVALAAKGVAVAEKVRRMALEANSGVGGPATAWATGEKVSAVNAALIAGTLSDMLDWEDCSWTGHPSAGIIPAAWIAAEERHKCGREMLAAVVAAYDVYQRIAMAVQPDRERWINKGWGLTSWQIFGAIISVAKLYGLDARRVNQAIGVGCECSTIPTAYHAVTMSDFYHYEHGYRARDAFLIVKSVEKGIHNQMDALDEPRCYTGVICDEPKLEWLTKDLGTDHLIMKTLMKHWPANMWVQTSAEIVHNLVSENGIVPKDIEEIIIDPPVRSRMWAPDEGFTSVTHAQFSVPYVIASMLYDPRPGAQWYTPERMKDPKIIAMTKRIKGGTSPEDSPMTGFAQFREGSYPMKTVTLTTRDGRKYVGKMDCHPGHPANMMTREQFIDRFRIQASPVLQGERMEQFIKALCDIENCGDIAELSGFLS